jgi:prephenate dehydratase
MEPIPAMERSQYHVHMTNPVVTQPMHATLPRVAFQGEAGAFSEMAIRQHWPDGADAMACLTFTEAVQRVCEQVVDFAVIPVENAIAGLVQPAHDAMREAGDRLQSCGEVRVPIHLCLMAPHGASLAGLREVRSHAVALAQCRLFFARHEWLVSVPHADTAGAARDVATWGDLTRGAVASESAAARYGLEIIAHHIQDIPHNWTRFVVLQRRD